MSRIISHRHWISVGLVILLSVSSWAQRPELVVQSGHSLMVSLVAFSPDGKTLASGSADNTIILWDISSRRELRTLRMGEPVNNISAMATPATRQASGVNSIAFSPDGKILAAGGYDKTIRLWDVSSGRELHRFAGHSAPVTSLVFSPNAKILASGGKSVTSGTSDTTIKIWDVTSGQELRTLTGHSSGIDAIAFSADGKTLASCGNDQKVKVWDVMAGRELSSFTAALGSGSLFGSTTLFSSDGKFLAAYRGDNIQLWDVATGAEFRKFVCSPFVMSMAWSADGKTFASDGLDGTTQFWDVTTGNELRTITGHSDLATAMITKLLSLMSAPADSSASATKRSLLDDFLAPLVSGQSDLVTSIALSGDGKMLAAASADKSIKLWDVATGNALRPLSGHASPITSVVSSANGSTLASGMADNTIRVWDVATGLRTLSGHSGAVSSVALSPDGQSLASGSMDHTIKLWDMATGRALRTLTALSDVVTCVAFSTDGAVLASAGLTLQLNSSQKNPIELWDVKTGQKLRTLAGHQNGVSSLAFSADGRTLASGGEDKTLKLWDISTGNELRTLAGHTDFVRSVAFSPDGKLVASSSLDHTIKLWEALTGTELRTLRGHAASVVSVVFSSDGKILASSSDDGTIKLWDVATGRDLRTLSGHLSEVSSIAFTAGGKFLISGSTDATIKLWRVDSGELLASMIALDDHDWAVVAPDGRFDGSANAQNLMYWRVGNEIIEFEQLKYRYFEPGLLSKLLGFNHEPQRNVKALQDVKLYPTAQWKSPAPGSAKAQLILIDRGGGVGKVQIFVNGREVIDDARGPAPTSNRPETRREIDLQQFQRFMVPGKENKIEAITYNAEGYLASRGTQLVYVAPPEEKTEPPSLYALVVGVSKYQRGGNLPDLNFAAKDAEAIATALRAAGEPLFPGRTNIAVLSTSSTKPDEQPTRVNIVNSLSALASKSKPTDILLLYFAGHGVSYGGQDGDFYFLTSDASTGDLKDPQLRETTALSSEDLAKLIINIPANKQVMILDTCASGRLIEQLTKSRSVDSSTIRAWDRMKDRTGLWVLAGSAADAVSYESSRYGEGVLTYSLLKGMKVDFEKALRKGEGDSAPEFVDVSTLFNYSADTVPSLARGIGGIQKPLIASKRDARSFDIGRVTSANRPLIPYTVEKPVYVRADFQLAGRPRDSLDLTTRIDAHLREASARGLDAPLVFWDLPEQPSAFRIAGRYEIKDTRVSVQVFVSTFKQEGERIEEQDMGQPFTVDGEVSDVDGLVGRILDESYKFIASVKSK